MPGAIKFGNLTSKVESGTLQNAQQLGPKDNSDALKKLAGEQKQPVGDNVNLKSGAEVTIDDKGNQTTTVKNPKTGEVTKETIKDKNGNLVSEKEYITEENEVVPQNTDLKPYTQKTKKTVTTNYENGQKSDVAVADENGKVLNKQYFKDGKPLQTETYTYDDDGKGYHLEVANGNNQQYFKTRDGEPTILTKRVTPEAFTNYTYQVGDDGHIKVGSDKKPILATEEKLESNRRTFTTYDASGNVDKVKTDKYKKLSNPITGE
jgi:antitoxin component YwqK of YwqJK toxin-antitoxin module